MNFSLYFTTPTKNIYKVSILCSNEITYYIVNITKLVLNISTYKKFTLQENLLAECSKI